MVHPPSDPARLPFFPIGRDRLLYKQRRGQNHQGCRDVLGGMQKKVFAEPIIPIHSCFYLLQLWLYLDFPPLLFWQWLKPDDHNPDYPTPGISLPNQMYKNV